MRPTAPAGARGDPLGTQPWTGQLRVDKPGENEEGPSSYLHIHSRQLLLRFHSSPQIPPARLFTRTSNNLGSLHKTQSRSGPHGNNFTRTPFRNDIRHQLVARRHSPPSPTVVRNYGALSLHLSFLDISALFERAYTLREQNNPIFYTRIIQLQ